MKRKAQNDWKYIKDDQAVDVLVRWDDHSQNVVSSDDLLWPESPRLQVGVRVKMWWPAEHKFYHGVVIELEAPDSTLDPVNSSTLDDEDATDDIPLARLQSMNTPLSSDATDDDGEDDIPLAELKNNQRTAESDDDSERQMDTSVDSIMEINVDPDYEPSDSEGDSDHGVAGDGQNLCEHVGCIVEIFAACPVQTCQALLCYDHFAYSDPCSHHGGAPRRPVELKTRKDVPENYDVEGYQRISSGVSPVKEKQRSDKERVRNEAKKNRNFGLPYVSEGTGIERPAKRILKPRCNSSKCESRGLKCGTIEDAQRQKIINSFYDLGDLQSQRIWLARHITSVKPTKQRVAASRKKKTLQYMLPSTDGNQLPVCRVMFHNTCGATERMVRTAIAKVADDGTMGTEGRGGRSSFYQDRDAQVRARVSDHINRFPRMESHYCRQKTGYQYLSHELTVAKMHALFNEEYKDHNVSLSFYAKVFSGLKLKFHRPKKDQCGLCIAYRTGTAEDKERLQERYTRHQQEKDQVRRIKQGMKERAQNDEDFLAANFDLEQVLFLPQTQRGEIFYKRKLSCYNFTVYDMGTSEGHCYFWHEGLACRGANEISSCIFNYLKQADMKGIIEVAFFCDGCGGQNKNSILPVMLMNFLQEHAQNISRITVYFFETNHGQCEGDSMHSTVERAIKRAGDLAIPSQLAMVIRLARKRPYVVKEVQTGDILDWKAMSRDLGILRIRTTNEGQGVDWTKVMQLRVDKEKPDHVFLKASHLDDHFQTITLKERRASIERITSPGKAYASAPKLSQAKYSDLVGFTLGDTPVITDPFYIDFYRNLPH